MWPLGLGRAWPFPFGDMAMQAFIEGAGRDEIQALSILCEHRVFETEEQARYHKLHVCMFYGSGMYQGLRGRKGSIQKPSWRFQ